MSEETLLIGLAAIEEIKSCVSKLANDLKNEDAQNALDSLMCRIEYLFMDCESIRDDELEM